MRPHDVDYRLSSHFREIVSADHGMIVAAPYIVHTRFELDQVVHMRPGVRSPFHVANDAAEWKSAARIAAGQLLEELQHSFLIEAAVTKIRFGVAAKLELSAALDGRRIDACRSQAS